jgi:hypothetical protein
MARKHKVTGNVWIDGQKVPKEVVVTGTRQRGFVEEGYIKDDKDKQPVKKGIYGDIWLFDRKE